MLYFPYLTIFRNENVYFSNLRILIFSGGEKFSSFCVEQNLVNDWNCPLNLIIPPL